MEINPFWKLFQYSLNYEVVLQDFKEIYTIPTPVWTLKYRSAILSCGSFQDSRSFFTHVHCSVLNWRWPSCKSPEFAVYSFCYFRCSARLLEALVFPDSNFHLGFTSLGHNSKISSRTQTGCVWRGCGLTSVVFHLSRSLSSVSQSLFIFHTFCLII
jgi:hypothetical protein